MLPEHLQSIVHFQRSVPVDAIRVEGAAYAVTDFYQGGSLKMNPS